MRKGYLSSYFEGIAVKRLSAVEAHPDRSNQHEFNGVSALKVLLGAKRRTFTARFLYLGGDEEDSASGKAWLTWYDAREQHPTRSEYRLYFPTTAVSELAAEGDLLIIGKRPNGELLVLVVKEASTTENQVRWLFALEPPEKRRFSIRDIENGSDIPVNFAARYILEELGVEPEPDGDYVELVLKQFPDGFPSTRVFSAFARETLKGLSSLDDPDSALVAWMDREEALFRSMERHLVMERIRRGFGSDVDAFVEFSLSVHNRRKSRAGFALENHLEEIFQEHKVRYSRGASTEGRSTPDFLFPGVREYRDDTFPAKWLSMLGVKSTCKERWRQVLAEASRITTKHLLTLEPGISETQTAEMQRSDLHLVLPRSLHETYSESQRGWLLNVQEFIGLVRSKQQ